MRAVHPLKSLVALVTPLLGAFLLMLQSGCLSDDNRARFYTYCDFSGCYQCDAAGCTAQPGRAPGAACKSSAECATGCFCGPDSKCAEAGFCDRPTDCARGYVCNTARHSCEPDTGTTGNLPTSCRIKGDCAAGSECINQQCKPSPVPENHCVFNRECGLGGACVDGLCQKACTDDSSCGTGRTCQNSRCAPRPADNKSCVGNAQCMAGDACIDSSCLPACAKDTDCQAKNKNDLCVAGRCRPDERRVAECRTNGDCGSGKECVNAQCRTFCVANSDCAACTDGSTVCATGYCVTTREAAPQCSLAPDCKSAKVHCVDGACAQ